MSERALPVLMGAAAMGYVVCAQLGAHTDRAWLSSLAVALLALTALLPGLIHRRFGAVIAALFVAVALIVAITSGWPRLPGYFVPPLLLALVGWFFGRTLAANSEPLIARIVRALDGDDFARTPAVARYARRLTQLWAGLLGVLAFGATALALCVVPDGLIAAFGATPPWSLTPAQWSQWVNLGGYGSVALAFAAEFALRRVLLPQAPKRSFSDFARRVARLWPELRRP